MARKKIPISQLTPEELDFYCFREAHKLAYQKFPSDTLLAENAIKGHEAAFRARFAALIKDSQAHRIAMPEVTPEECGRSVAAQLPPPGRFRPKPKETINSFWLGQPKFPYNKTQLSKLGFLHYQGAQLAHLSGPILPLLALSKWRVSTRIKEALDPVLRLASKFLTSPASIRYFHAFLFNGRVEDRVATRTWGIPLMEIPTSAAQAAPTWQLTSPVL